MVRTGSKKNPTPYLIIIINNLNFKAHPCVEDHHLRLLLQSRKK